MGFVPAPFTYLFLLLIWALPVIVMQWLVGGDLLRRRWKVLLPAILIPTIYLTCADSLALASKTWTISPEQSLNIFFPLINVPVEEGIFFLLTNTMITQGLILLRSQQMRDRVRGWFRLAQGTAKREQS